MNRCKFLLSYSSIAILLCFYYILTMDNGRLGVTLMPRMYLASFINLFPVMSGFILGRGLKRPCYGHWWIVDLILILLLLPAAFPGIIIILFGASNSNWLVTHGNYTTAAMIALISGILLGHLPIFIYKKGGHTGKVPLC